MCYTVDMYQEDDNRIPGMPGTPAYATNMFCFTSFVLACIAVFSVLTGVFPIMLGSLSIILALLSRGREVKLSSSAKLSVSISVFAMIVGACITIAAAYSIMTDPEMMDFIKQLYNAVSNMDYDEYMRLLREYYNTHGNTRGKGFTTL
ncbi:MAG: hypothetical protein K5686_07280 [Lachnospiraceae bacterium]|nr:hypothetical protein [Lachnospiraceae bacterium]